jgi:transcriptional regulator with XRE-family HTH domain
MLKKTRRKLKDYDDDLLVELIARGDLTNKQIAQRVGISPTQVTTISLGRSRGDLQPRINEALRSYIWEVRRRQRQQPGRHADHPPAPLSHRHKEYDDDRLVELIAAGSITHPKIAAEIGISKSMVSRIARGEARPDLQPRIQALVGGRRDEFERLAATVLTPSLVKQAKVGLEGEDETARKAREYIMDTFRYPPDPAKQAGRTPGPAGDISRRPKLPMRSLTELSPALKAAVLKELGGYDPDDPGETENGIDTPQDNR